MNPWDRQPAIHLPAHPAESAVPDEVPVAAAVSSLGRAVRADSAVGHEVWHRHPATKRSFGNEVVSVDEHQIAGVQLHRPSPGRVDMAATDIDGLARQVTKILHNHPRTLAVGARVDAHPHVHRQLRAGAVLAVSKHCSPLPSCGLLLPVHHCWLTNCGRLEAPGSIRSIERCPLLRMRLMPLSAGETFAGYRIVRLLGSGGMGEVYLAEHPRLPRRDALKVLLAEVSADPDYRERFVREADLAAKLWHPNIVGVHDRGESGGQLWIAMDYVAGTNATDLLKDRYPDGMPADEVSKIVTAVASALDYAHKQGLLHRDVKPANIMLTDPDEDGERRILLSDFGVARNAGEISGLTATNMTVGTVAYAAPEQLMGEDLDGRADEYALAASTYHMLTGSQLFPHSNAAVVISHHLNSPPPALADTRPELAALEPVLARALAKDPEDRFPRCSDFARALADPSDEYSSPSAGTATKPAPLLPMSKPGDSETPATGEPPRRPALSRIRRRWLIPAALITIVLLASITALTWHLWDSGRPSATTAPPPSPAGPLPSPTVGPPSPPLFPASQSTVSY